VAGPGEAFDHGRKEGVDDDVLGVDAVDDSKSRSLASLRMKTL
jgi:hypothetical protein